MELIVFLKQMADMGVTPPVVIALGIAWQIHKTNVSIDKRVTIIETKLSEKAA